LDPEEALAVFELVDDLRDRNRTVYRTDLQDLIGKQRQPGSIDPVAIDGDDLPY
jgi:hypothetical protein